MIKFEGVVYAQCKKCIYSHDFEECVKVSKKCDDGRKGYFVEGSAIETLPFDGELVEKEVK